MRKLFTTLLLFVIPVAFPGLKLLAASPADVSSENEQKLGAAFERLYNLEFDSAQELFREVVRDEPESATARTFLASALLYEILARQGSLQSQLFVMGNKFLHQGRKPPDPELKQRFEERIDEARAVAERRRKANKNDPDALFALGLAYANLANYSTGVEGKYFRGLRYGKKAYKYHKKLHELHPDLYDTGVVLGTHNYVLGSLPRVMRFFLFFVGARGNRERGLRHLQEAAESGTFLRTYARVLLAVAWIREEKPEEAQRVLEALRSDYPRNPLFLFELARFYRQQGLYPEAAQVCREMLTRLRTRPLSPRILGPEDALLELGRVESAAGNPEAALHTLRQIDRVAAAEQRIVAWSLIERGRIFDQMGERRMALAEYDKVILLAADPESIRLAHAYKKKPYRPEVNSSPKPRTLGLKSGGGGAN
ncbi:MAG: tetratricopeptide repeat protein [Candidatus Acidoferrales bacterium]